MKVHTMYYIAYPCDAHKASVGLKDKNWLWSALDNLLIDYNFTMDWLWGQFVANNVFNSLNIFAGEYWEITHFCWKIQEKVLWNWLQFSSNNE